MNQKEIELLSIELAQTFDEQLTAKIMKLDLNDLERYQIHGTIVRKLATTMIIDIFIQCKEQDKNEKISLENIYQAFCDDVKDNIDFLLLALHPKYR